jgi:hypothetical protein
VTEDRAARQEKSAHARSQVCPSDRGALHFSMTAARTPCYTSKTRLREALQLFFIARGNIGPQTTITVEEPLRINAEGPWWLLHRSGKSVWRSSCLHRSTRS